MRWSIFLALIFWVFTIAVCFGQTTTAPVTTTVVAKGKTVFIGWQHTNSNPVNYVYTVHYEEIRNMTQCHYSSRFKLDIQVDGRTFDAICDWCAVFGGLPMAIKIKAHDKRTGLDSPWSSEVSYQGGCP